MHTKLNMFHNADRFDAYVLTNPTDRENPNYAPYLPFVVPEIGVYVVDADIHGNLDITVMVVSQEGLDYLMDLVAKATEGFLDKRIFTMSDYNPVSIKLYWDGLFSAPEGGENEPYWKITVDGHCRVRADEDSAPAMIERSQVFQLFHEFVKA